jgi:hypothetical protein
VGAPHQARTCRLGGLKFRRGQFAQDDPQPLRADAEPFRDLSPAQARRQQFEDPCSAFRRCTDAFSMTHGRGF